MCLPLKSLPSASWASINVVVAYVGAVSADTLVVFQKFHHFAAIGLKGEVGCLAT